MALGRHDRYDHLVGGLEWTCCFLQLIAKTYSPLGTLKAWLNCISIQLTYNVEKITFHNE